MCLAARLGEAKVIYELGDFEEADRRMEAVTVAAASERSRWVRAEAWHDRAAIACTRHRYEEAAEYLYESWTLQRHDGHARDRLLADLAVALQNSGHRQLARRAHLLLTRAHHPQSRWIAQINLMHIASLDRDEREFDASRGQLDEAPFPPWIQWEYFYYSGVGLATFGRLAESRDALSRAAAIADAHHMHERSHRAADARRGVVPPSDVPDATAPLPWGLRRASNALFAFDMMVRSATHANGDYRFVGSPMTAGPAATLDRGADAPCS
jgi:hypothetical protein